MASRPGADGYKPKQRSRSIADRPKAGALKVVDVRLSERNSKKKTAKGKAATAEKPKRVLSPAGRQPVKKAVAKKPAKSAKDKKKVLARAQNAVLAKKPAVVEKTAIAAAPSPEMAKSLAVLLAPTMEVLKPFRDAALKTKKLQRERDRAKRVRGDFLAKPCKKGKRYAMDLRVHTPASHGFFSTGGVDPAPAWVRLARVKGLDMVAITDYYNVAMIDPVCRHAAGTGISVFPGLDMRCWVGMCDEISIIALFPETHDAMRLQMVLDQLNVPSTAYGDPNYVLAAPFEEVLQIVEAHEGIIIPSRVDKTPYRNLAIPLLVEKFGIHAFDLVHPECPDFFRDRWPSGGFTFFSFSNANALGQIGSRRAAIRLEEGGFAGLKAYLQRRPVPATESVQDQA